MARRNKIYFRADAGVDIGFGHFIRTLALADLLKNDYECTFFTQDPTKYQKEELDKVCKYIVLPSDDTKFDVFVSFLQGDEIVVLDNYFFSTDYQHLIKLKGCKLVCIDDLHDKHFVADAVINHSLGINISDYSIEPYTKLYLGLGYALLRKPFLDVLRKNEIHDIKNFDSLTILLSFGGTDKQNLTSYYLEMLKELNNVAKIYVVIGDAYSGEMLEDLKVEYRRNISAEEMALLFQLVDIAILPASTVMKEALACKTFVIGGYFVGNQINSYRMFSSINAIVGIGDFTDQQALKKLKSLLTSKSLADYVLVRDVIPVMTSVNLKKIFNELSL